MARFFYVYPKLVVMNRNIFYCLLIIVAGYSEQGCSAKKENSTAAETGNKINSGEKLAGCYRLSIEKDTALLNLDVVDSSVSGTLFYRPFEKDKSSGTIKGILENSVLKVWYTFQSEGLSSVRQLYFKVMNGQLSEGYGDVIGRNDSICYKYPANLNYEELHVYSKLDCK